MKRTLTVTDVTRMQEGRVCVAGYDESGNCIRPVLPPPGIHESSLYAHGRPIVFPFAVVEYELLHPDPRPPHTEDWRYEPSSVRFIKRLDERQQQELLARTLFPSISALFDVPILSDPGHYVLDGQGPRSLGTIRPQRVMRALYEQSAEGKWRYRLGFVDGSNASYWLTITDLTWRYYSDHLGSTGRTPGDISSHLTSILKSGDTYLRIGLARGWQQFPDRCYLQITGVYSFPGFLGDRTFADFAPGRGRHGRNPLRSWL